MDLTTPMPSDLPLSVPVASNVAAPDVDRELLLRYRDHGDSAALETLLQRHAEVAYRVALRATGNASDAEDVLQEGFIACMASAKQFRGTGSVRSWIIAIVANAQRRQARAQRRRRRHEGRAPEPVQPMPSRDDAMGVAAIACLAELPDRYRIPLAMRHLDALEFADIAAALGGKEKTVRTQVGRGLERLRAALSRRGFAVSALAVTAVLGEATAAVPPHIVNTVGSAMAKGLSLSPKALGAAAVSIGGIGGLAVLAKITLAMVVVAAGAGALVWWELRPITLLLVAEEPVVVVAQTQFERALDQRLTLDFTENLPLAIECIRRALPNDVRVRVALPSSLIDQNIEIRLALNDVPLRGVLDALCVDADLRWTTSSAGIVIDRPLVAAERAQREAAFSEQPDAMTAAALSESSDVQTWRVLLLALAGDDQRATIAAQVLPKILQTGLGPVIGGSISPVIVFSDDQAVCAAVEQAFAANREPQSALISLAGHLRLRSVVPACLELVATGRGGQNFVQKMLRDRQPIELGAAACTALGLIGDIRALPVLLTDLASVENPIHAHQITALGHLGSSLAVTDLLAIVSDRHQWGPMRGTAVTSLAVIGDRAAVPAIATIVMDNTDDAPFVRRPAVAALGWLGGPDAEVALREQAGLGKQSNTWVCGAAIRELAYIPGPESDAVLLHMLNDYFNGDSAATVLASRRSPELVSALTERLHHAARRNNGDTYSHIASALARNADPLAQQALIAATVEASERHAWEHARALAICAEPAAEQALMAMVAAGQPVNIRRDAANALGGSGPAAQALAVRLVAEDPDLEVRTRAMTGFDHTIRMNGRHPLDQATWQEWLRSTEPVVRATAIGLIAVNSHFGRTDRFDRTFTITAVAAALADVSPEVRRSLVRSGDAKLFHSLDPSLWEPYVALLTTDSDAQVRETVAANVFLLTFPSWTISNDELATLMNHLLSASTVDVDPRVRAQAGVTVMQIIRRLREDNVHRGIAIDVVEGKIRAHHASEADARVRLLMTRVLDPQQSYLDINLDEFGKFDPTESNPGAMPSVNEDF